jgi:hypothetical protein
MAVSATPTSARPVRALLFATAAALALAALAGAGRSAPAPATLDATSVTPLAVASPQASGRVRIVVTLPSRSKGTFTMTGAIADKGSVKATQRVAGGKLDVTETLVGTRGTIRLRATSTCPGGKGTWKVLSGSGEHAGSSGGGRASGGPRCAVTRYPVSATYTGAVRTVAPPPPPPLAQPGRFGGGTSQREEVVFDVEGGGRSLASFRARFTVKCDPTMTLGGPTSWPGPYAIAADGTFAFEPAIVSGVTYRVTGRFTSPTTAVGTLSANGTAVNPMTNTQVTCAGEIAWTASLPPPAALPGTYCGFTLQGSSICLDVPPSGREVTRFESAVVARCFPGGVAPSEFEIGLTYTGSIPIGGHLGFSARGLAVEGLGTTASISGLFEPTGTVAGSVGLGAFDLDYEGTRYRCFSSSGKFEAKRQQ